MVKKMDQVSGADAASRRVISKRKAERVKSRICLKTEIESDDFICGAGFGCF
jgi:hypothetical protein